MDLLKYIINYEYITREHLNGFDKYKYSAVDTSPISKYVTNPFWERLVRIYPKWLAPNLITFTGFLCLIISFVTFSYYDFHFYGYCHNQEHCSDPSYHQLNYNRFHQESGSSNYSNISLYLCSCIPSALWLVGAICQFLSHHLDGTDGKQARRLKVSSPLGELFDHGLDSWATLFLPVALYSIFGRGKFGASTLDMYYVLWVIMASFIISHWEKYNTGILFLPWTYDLSQIAMTLAFCLTFMFGQQFWYFDFNSYFRLTAVKLIEFAIYMGAIGFSVPFTIYNMLQAYKTKTFKQNSLYEAMRPLLPTVYLFVIQQLWIINSKVNIIESEPRAFYWLTGTLFSNISCRLIVAQMTSTRCQIFNWLLLPLTACIVLIMYEIIKAEQERLVLYLLALLVTLSHVHYGVCMVRQICKHLNIYCFKITSRPIDKKN